MMMYNYWARLDFAAVMCAVGMFVPSVASAGIIFQDGFEDDTIGSVPAINGGDLGDGWSTTLATSPGHEAIGQVHSEGEGSGSLEGVAPHAGSGSQYLLLSRVFGTSPIASGDLSGQPFSSGVVSLSFNAYLKSGAGRGQVFFSDGLNTGAFDRLANIFFQSGQVLEFDGSALVPIPGLIFEVDAWQEVKVDLDLDTNTYSIDIGNGASTGGSTMLGDAVSANRELGALHVSAAGDGAVFFVDDVVATHVPEPMTGSLAILAVVSAVGLSQGRALLARAAVK